MLSLFSLAACVAFSCLKGESLSVGAIAPPEPLPELLANSPTSSGDDVKTGSAPVPVLPLPTLPLFVVYGLL